MRASKPIAGLVAVGILGLVVGGVYSLATATLSGAADEYTVTAAGAVLGVSIVVVLAMAALGSRGVGRTTPYW